VFSILFGGPHRCKRSEEKFGINDALLTKKEEIYLFNEEL
jgi:hypothetical protein